MNIAAILFIGAGMAAIAVGVADRSRHKVEDLAEILGLPFGERDVPVEALTERRLPAFTRAGSIADQGLRRVDRKGSVAAALATARMPITAGEYVLLVATGSLVAAAVLTVVLSNAVLGIAGAIAVAYGATQAPKVFAKRRRRQIEAQLPDALATIAASLEGGHTFLRSIHMLAEEADSPLRDELAEVVRATALNAPLIDALDRMAARLRIQDLDWAVHAIRIQQATGGRLSEVLHTLADFMRGREELRREVNVLTAEGRVSAIVLTATPPLLFVTFQVMNPKYSSALLHGWGLVALGLAAASTALGCGIILRMVKIEV